MRRKKTGKRWAALALAAVLAAGTAQPMGAEAAGGTYTGSGTFHIDQFGEYDINASVSVTDGVITGLEITGDNFGGTYAEVNKGRLASAVEGMQQNRALPRSFGKGFAVKTSSSVVSSGCS